MSRLCAFACAVVLALSLGVFTPLQAADPLNHLIFDGNVEYHLDDFPGQTVVVISFCRS